MSDSKKDGLLLASLQNSDCDYNDDDDDDGYLSQNTSSVLSAHGATSTRPAKHLVQGEPNRKRTYEKDTAKQGKSCSYLQVSHSPSVSMTIN